MGNGGKTTTKEKEKQMKFGTIIADPPWNYSRTSNSKKLRGYSDKQYSPLTTNELANLDVASIAEDNSILFLWTTGPMLVSSEAIEVAKGWGFSPVTLLYWHKTKQNGLSHLGGVGYWVRGNCEPILVAKRGKSYRWNAAKSWTQEDASALFSAPTQGHSVKPNTLHERIEHYPYPKPWLEMFGRRAREGWIVIGDEAPKIQEEIRESIERLKNLT